MNPDETDKQNNLADEQGGNATSRPAMQNSSPIITSIPDSLYIKKTEINNNPGASRFLGGSKEKVEPPKEESTDSVQASQGNTTGIKLPKYINVNGGKIVDQPEQQKSTSNPDDANESLDSAKSLWIMKPLNDSKKKKNIIIGKGSNEGPIEKLTKEIELDENFDPFAKKSQRNIDSLSEKEEENTNFKKIEEEEEPELELSEITGGINSDGIPVSLESMVQRKKYLSLIAVLVTGLFAFSAFMLSSRLQNNDVSPPDSSAQIPTATPVVTQVATPTPVILSVTPTLTPILTPTTDLKATPKNSITPKLTTTVKPTNKLTVTQGPSQTPTPTVTTTVSVSPTPTPTIKSSPKPTIAVIKTAAECQSMEIINLENGLNSLSAGDRARFVFKMTKPTIASEVRLIYKVSNLLEVNTKQKLPKGCSLISSTFPRQQILFCSFTKKTLPPVVEFRAKVITEAQTYKLETFAFLDTKDIGTSVCGDELSIIVRQQPTAIPTTVPTAKPTATPKIVKPKATKQPTPTVTKKVTITPTVKLTSTPTLTVTPTLRPSVASSPTTTTATVTSTSVVTPTVKATAIATPTHTPKPTKLTPTPTVFVEPTLPLKDVGVGIAKSGVAQCINSNTFVQVHYYLDIENAAKEAKTVNVVDILDEKIKHSELDFVTFGGEMKNGELRWDELRIDKDEQLRLEYQIIIPVGEGNFANKVEVRNSKDLVKFAEDELVISTECLPIVSIEIDRSDVLVIAGILMFAGIMTFAMGWHVKIGEKIHLKIGYMLPKSSQAEDFEEEMRKSLN